MDGGACWAAVHGVAKSQTPLSDFTFPFHFHALEKEMATHSSILAWRIPGTGEPGGLSSMGLHRVGHDWSDLAAATAAAAAYSIYINTGGERDQPLVLTILLAVVAPHCLVSMTLSDNWWDWVTFHLFIDKWNASFKEICSNILPFLKIRLSPSYWGYKPIVGCMCYKYLLPFWGFTFQSLNAII